MSAVAGLRKRTKRAKVEIALVAVFRLIFAPSSDDRVGYGFGEFVEHHINRTVSTNVAIRRGAVTVNDISIASGRACCRTPHEGILDRMA